MKLFRLLLTRPKGLNISNRIAEDSCRKISFFPLIIISFNKIQPIVIKLSKLKKIDIFIFISKHSIKAVMPTIIKFWSNYKKIIYITIGSASAKELKKFGIDNVLYSFSNFPNSSKVLQLKELKHIKNDRIIIFKGNDGNSLLYNTLKGRGAIVYSIISYSRKPPLLKHFIRHVNKNICDIVSITSLNSLKNFFLLINGCEKKSTFLKKVLIVTSTRVKYIANTLGFKKVIVSPSYNIKNILKDINNLSLIKKYD